MHDPEITAAQVRADALPVVTIGPDEGTIGRCVYCHREIPKGGQQCVRNNRPCSTRHYSETGEFEETRQAFVREREEIRDQALQVLRCAYFSDHVPSDASHYAIWREVMYSVMVIARDRVRHEYGGF